MAARILLVEDEPTLQRIMGSVLVHAGHVVDAVGSAEAALGRMQEDRQEYDLVLADKNLPAMNGVELLGRVRAMERDEGMHLGFVMVTGYPSRDSVRDVLHEGGDGYLVKPFRSLTEAVAQVSTVLEEDLAQRRSATARAKAVQDAVTASIPCDEVFWVDLGDGPSTDLVVSTITGQGMTLDQDKATAYVVDRVEKMSNPEAVGLWVTDEPAFNDLVDSVWRGGVRCLDPFQLRAPT